MSLLGVIASLATPGPYTVTRTAAGATDNLGRWVPGSTSQFTIVASIQPQGGRQLRSLPEAEHGEEIRVAYTSTELRARTPDTDSDVVTINSESWRVIRVERWEHFGETHYNAYLARQVLP